MVFQCQDDPFCFFEVLFPAHFQVRFFVHRLDTYFKPEHSFWNLFLDELHDGRMQNISSDFELENLSGFSMIQNKLKDIKGKILFHVECPVQELDHLTMLHQVAEVAFDVIHRQVTHPVVEAGQTELTFIRATPGGLDVQYPVDQCCRVIVLIRV